MTVINIFILCSKVGIVEAYEDPMINDGVARDFVRARVAINTEEPLIAGFWVPRPGMSQIWVTVKYEKLQNFCYNFGRVGHDLRSCRKQKTHVI